MSQKPVYVYAQWHVKDGHVDAVLELLQHVAGKTLQEKGNLFYKVHQNQSDKNNLILFEGYSDADAVEAHRHSQHYKSFVAEQIIPLLEKREVILMDQLM